MIAKDTNFYSLRRIFCLGAVGLLSLWLWLVPAEVLGETRNEYCYTVYDQSCKTPEVTCYNNILSCNNNSPDSSDKQWVSNCKTTVITTEYCFKYADHLGNIKETCLGRENACNEEQENEEKDGKTITLDCAKRESKPEPASPPTSGFCLPPDDPSVTGVPNEAGDLSFIIESHIWPKSIQELLLSILQILIVIITPIIVFFIIFAGFLYVTANGNPENIKKATRTFTYAVIGAIMVIGAVAIAEILKNLVDAFR